MKLFISFTRQIRRNKSPFFLIFSFRKKRRDTFVEIPPILTEGARINREEEKKKSVYQDAQGFWLGQGGRDWPSEWKRGIGIVGLRWPAGWQWNRATVNELIAGTIIIPRSRAPLRPRRLLADYESIVASVINPSHPSHRVRVRGSTDNVEIYRRVQRSSSILAASAILLGFRLCRSIATDFFFFQPLFFSFFAFNKVNEINGKIDVVAFFLLLLLLFIFRDHASEEVSNFEF